MTAGDRFRDWIDKTASGWADRLANWGMGLLARGATKTLEGMEPGAIATSKETIKKILSQPNISPELRNLLEKSIQEGDIFSVITGWIMTILGSVFQIMGLGRPLGRVWEYTQDQIWKSARFDPLSVITAWRRDPEKYAELFDDLRDLGWHDDRIEALKFITQYMPTPQQVIAWLAHEVFEPEMISKYGLDDEFGGLDLTIPRQIGMTDEMSLNEWRNHWQHASWIQIVEMLHRGLITEDEVYDWFRLVEIPPFWRDLLIQTAYSWPTRVDVRRFYDLETIDEDRLREIYSGMGYRGKNLEDYVLWTKIYVKLPDLLAQWKNGWITLDDVRSRLIGYGMRPEAAEELIRTKVKAVEPTSTAEGKELTKTEIYKGVKTGTITYDQAIDLLIDLKYTYNQAAYLLAINIPTDEIDEVVKERQLTKADILSGLKTAVITREEARQKLLELRYSPANVDLLLKIYDAQVKPPEEPKLREASKADIVLGVKKGIITQEEGYLMLLDIDFSPDAAGFILTVQTEESPFSPRSYSEFKKLTEQYLKTVETKGEAMPEELKKLADQVVKQTDERDRIKRVLNEKLATVTDEESLPAEEREELGKLRTTLYQAEAELKRLTTEYQDQLAVWRQQTTK